MKKILVALTGALFLLASCSTSSGDDSDDSNRAFVPGVQISSSASSYYVGESVELKAVASGNGTLSYQWYKVDGEKDVEIKDATEAVYTSQETEAGDFSYAVLVKNTVGGKSAEKRSENVKISVSIKEASKAEKPWVNEIKSEKLTYAAGESIKISVKAIALDGGVLSYKWFKDDEEIAGATENEYTWAESAPGAYKFKVSVTSTLNETTATTESENIEIIVSDVAKRDAETPKFTTALASLTCKVGENAKLAVDATVSDGGTITWQWYKVDSDNNSSAIAGAKNKEFTIPTEDFGETTYKVIATNNNSSATGETKAEASLSCVVIVYDPSKKNAKVPSIVSQPQSVTYTEIDEIKPLTVVASVESAAGEEDDIGVYKYAWYKVGDEEAVADTESYTPQISEIGSASYYVVVTNEYANATGNKTASVKSDVATITVNAYEPTKPVITKQPASSRYMLKDLPEDLSVKAVVDEGKLSYQWYMIVDGEEKLLEGETSKYYENISTEKEGSFNYFVRVTNTVEAKDKKYTTYTDSAIAKIVVGVPVENVDAAIPVFSKALENKSYEIGSAAVTALDGTATVSDSGKITYQWYTVVDGKDTVIKNAASATYTPVVTNAGSTTYKIIATNTNPSATGSTTSTSSMTVTITVVDITLKNAASPVIKTQPVSADYTEGDSVAALSVTADFSATGGEKGTLSYQWYKGEEAISDAKTATYTPDISVAGENSYYVIVTNTIEKNEGVGIDTVSVHSDTVKISVKALTVEKPSVSIDIEPTVYKVGEKYTFEAKVSGVKADANLSYAWYEGTSVVGTGSKYTDSKPSKGTYSYTLKVTNTRKNGTKTVSETGVASASVEVNEFKIVAETPVITKQPVSASYEADSTSATALNVVASVKDGGKLTYQWYSNSTDSNKNGTSISGATGDSYTPKLTEGTTYYYCVVTNTLTIAGESDSESTASAVATIYMAGNKTYAAKPEFDSQPESASYKQGDKANALTVNATATASGKALSGNITYQWYSNSANSNQGGKLISGATSKSYTPSTADAGEIYYYCVATNTADNAERDKTSSASSNAVKVSVGELIPAKPEISIEGGSSYVSGKSLTLTAKASSADTGAKFNYQWYKVNGTSYDKIENAIAATYEVKETATTETVLKFAVGVTSTVSNGSVAKTSAEKKSEIVEVKITLPSDDGNAGIGFDFN